MPDEVTGMGMFVPEWQSKKHKGWNYIQQGLMTEAVTEMIRHAFEYYDMNKIWCGYYDGNIRSKRVQEKCGFTYQWTTDNVDVPLMHETRKGFVSCLTKEEWSEMI